MSPLDELYGAGTTAAFAERCSLKALLPESTVTVTQQASPDCPCHVAVDWRTGKGVLIATVAIDFRGTIAHYSNRWIAKAVRGHELHARDVTAFRAFYKALGIVLVTASPENPYAEWLLKLGGFDLHEYEGQEYFGARLDVPDKTLEFAEWVKGGKVVGERPAWLTGLLANTV